MLVRKMVVLTTWAKLRPAAPRMVLRFSRDWRAWAAMSPSTSLPVAASSGNWPETNTRSPDSMAVEYGPMALALGVVMAFLGMATVLTSRSRTSAARFRDGRLRAQLRGDLRAGLDQALHRLHRLDEHLPLRGIEVDLDDLLHAVGADHHGNADVHALDAVLAVEEGGAGQHAALVLEVALGHLDGGGGRRIERRTRLQQVDDLAATLAGAVDNAVEPGLVEPAHLDEVGERNAGNRRVAGDRHHVVAMAPEHQRGH